MLVKLWSPSRHSKSRGTLKTLKFLYICVALEQSVREHATPTVAKIQGLPPRVGRKPDLPGEQLSSSNRSEYVDVLYGAPTLQRSYARGYTEVAAMV